jgi:hypothetical protein
MLEKESAYYENVLSQLLKSDLGKFVLIKNEKVYGTYDTIKDALKSGYEKFKAESFFVKEIQPVEQPLNFANNYYLI